MTGLAILVSILIVASIVASLVGNYLYGITVGLIVLAVALIVTGLVSYVSWSVTYKNDHWATCSVTGKDRGGEDGSYRIYTSDCGQFSNEDSVLRWKFDSADVWQQIPDSGPVEIRTAGVRIGFISQFPNVFEARSVN